MDEIRRICDFYKSLAVICEIDIKFNYHISIVYILTAPLHLINLPLHKTCGTSLLHGKLIYFAKV